MRKINHEQLFEEIRDATGLEPTEYAISITYTPERRVDSFELKCDESRRAEIMQVMRRHEPMQSDAEMDESVGDDETRLRNLRTIIKAYRRLDARIDTIEQLLRNRGLL